MYIEAFKNSGFKEEFTYLEPRNIKPNNDNLYEDKETTDNCNNKVKCHENRKRKILLFLWLANINIGNIFKWIDKQFNQYNILHKISNRKTLNISYSCTNMSFLNYQHS